MRRGRLFCAAILLGSTLAALATQRISAATPVVWQGDMIRLHVIAHSDREEDQRVKLCVRDALLETFGHALAAENFDAACNAVRDNLGAIEEEARRAAEAQGFSGGATATFGLYEFPTREYDGVRVPAGTYTALRVVLGDGAGRNWWCVMYPTLCLPQADCTATEQAAVPASGAAAPEVRFESTLVTWIQGILTNH